MILSASSVAALSDYGSSWYFFDRQLIWAIGGVVGVPRRASSFDYHRWRRWRAVAAGHLVRRARRSCSCRASASWSTARGAGSASDRSACSRARSRSSRCCAAAPTCSPRRADRLDDWRQWIAGAADARRARAARDARARPRLGDRARADRVRAADRGRRAPPAPRRRWARRAMVLVTGAGVRGAVPAGAHVRVPAPVEGPGRTPATRSRSR